jgi:hypothetical protein
MLALAFVAFGLARGVESDGARRVAIQRTPTTLEVRDDARRTRQTFGLAPGCTLMSLSRGGIVLLLCRDDYQTIDLRTGERDVYADPVGEYSDDDAGYVAAGRYWLALDHVGAEGHYEDREYVERLTGEMRRADGLRIYGDVDSPGLVKPLCAPLHRFGYEFPHNGAGWQPATSDGHAAVTERYGDELWRCGDRRPLRLGRTENLTAGGGWATWRGGALRLRDLRRLRLPRGYPQHTRRAVYLLHGRHLRWARLPAS